MLFLAKEAGKLYIEDVFIAVVIMLVIAIVFGFLIMVVSKKFAVKADGREEKVLSCLAGANCGGCGKAGCAALASALVEGSGQIDDCPVTDKGHKEEIAKILGVSYSGDEEYKFVTACGGGVNAVDRSEYIGLSDCVRESLSAGGRKRCFYGCLGDGTCVNACPTGAMTIVDGVSHIDEEKCIACGRCSPVCPKKIIKKIPKSAKVYVACSTLCRGKEVMDSCKVGCIGCGICMRNCPSKAIEMVDNLPQIDYTKCVGCGYCADHCPRMSIRKL